MIKQDKLDLLTKTTPFWTARKDNGWGIARRHVFGNFPEYLSFRNTHKHIKSAYREM